MFDKELFVASCRDALQEQDPQAAVKEIVQQTMSRPSDLVAALGTPTKGEIIPIYRSPELTILNIIWAPGFSIYPHDHRMWAVIGLYGGQEDNTFYRRSEHGLTKVGFKEIEAKQAVVLGDKVIHAVTNPRKSLTAAIHVYGGDFFNEPRSEWDPVTFEERPYDAEKAKRLFESANETNLPL